jgi:hypothetical protein
MGSGHRISHPQPPAYFSSTNTYIHRCGRIGDRWNGWPPGMLLEAVGKEDRAYPTRLRIHGSTLGVDRIAYLPVLSHLQCTLVVYRVWRADETTPIVMGVWLRGCTTRHAVHLPLHRSRGFVRLRRRCVRANVTLSISHSRRVRSAHVDALLGLLHFYTHSCTFACACSAALLTYLLRFDARDGVGR